MDWGDIISNALRAGVSREAAVFAIAAMGLNIQFGFTGLLNFGQVGFMAIGAYGVGISITYYGWNPVVALDRRDPVLRRSWPSSSACPPCASGPTTSPS